MGLERKERRLALVREAPRRGAQGAAAGPQPAQEGALVRAQAAASSEQVAILARIHQLPRAPLEHRDASREQSTRERRLRSHQLVRGSPLGGAGEIEERAPGHGEPLDLP